MSAANQNVTLNCALSLAANETNNVAASRTLTLGGALSGSGALIKAGTGTALISTANPSFSGGVSNIGGGTLRLAAGADLGTGPYYSANASTLTFLADTTFTNNGTFVNALNINGASGQTVNLTGAWTGGGGGMNLGPAGTTFVLSNPNTYHIGQLGPVGATTIIAPVAQSWGSTAGVLARYDTLYMNGATFRYTDTANAIIN